MPCRKRSNVVGSRRVRDRHRDSHKRRRDEQGGSSNIEAEESCHERSVPVFDHEEDIRILEQNFAVVAEGDNDEDECNAEAEGAEKNGGEDSDGEEVEDTPIDSEDNHPENDLGAMDVKCEFCCSLNFAGELPRDRKFTKCCQKGKVKLNRLDDYPPELKKFMDCEEGDVAAGDKRNFKKFIRQYNSAVSFASMGTQYPIETNSTNCTGAPFVRLHGQVYHVVTAELHPPEGIKPRYAQLYIVDTELATAQRMGIVENEGCLPHIMAEIDATIRAVNVYAAALKTMKEVEDDGTDNPTGRPIKNVCMSFAKEPGTDQRRYNISTAADIAAVFASGDGAPPGSRDLRIYSRAANRTQRVSILDSNVDSLVYPLIHPTGQSGWGPHLRQYTYEPGVWRLSTRRVSQSEYYAYRMARRELEFNPIHHSGKLFQMYVVDAYCKAEANRLQYVRTHQRELRCEMYAGLVDHVHNMADAEGAQAGKIVILPSSFQGSPRNCQEHYADAMAIVRAKGKPDIFVTFTANPKWKEITANLLPGQGPGDRPDIIARVFHLKLKQLLADLNSGMFGEVAACIHVVEFQKRGLPHAHILVILKEGHKPTTVDEINKLVRAEMPLKSTHPRLYQIVKQHMRHGPHGSKSGCMVNNKCVKGFPKAFEDETTNNVNGYPLYRRRQRGRHYDSKGREFTNAMVIPYNAILLMRYNAHINCEIVSSIKAVKYVFKYVYKGHDCCSLGFKETVGGADVFSWDEIRAYTDARFVGSSEACWRIFQFFMQKLSHAVTRLPIHLQNWEMVYFPPGGEAAAVANYKASKLSQYFLLNLEDPDARQYLYAEVPLHYSFNKPQNKWIKRPAVTGKPVIARINLVAPKDVERYSLRLLLLHVRGATSFAYLRTVDGIEHETFQAACRARNLVSDDSQWCLALDEAITLQFPKALRELFAYILVFGNPVDCCTLWKRYKSHMCEDFIRHTPRQAAENRALQLIQEVLLLHGKRCQDFRLPEPIAAGYSAYNIFDVAAEQEISVQFTAQLNLEQRHAFATIMNAVDNNDDPTRCFWIDGPGGSGKTFTYLAIISTIRARGETVLPVASTGIAANLLPKGRTYHSQFKLPLAINETSVSDIRPTSADGAAIRQAKLIIWDEAGMVSRYALEAVDRLLRDVRQDQRPFGGVAMCLGGDFRQTLVIVPHGNKAKILQECIKSSDLWLSFCILRLIRNLRAAPGDVEFASWLLKLGNGELLNDVGFSTATVCIPATCVTSAVVDDIYGPSISTSRAITFRNTAILTPLNESVNRINAEVIGRQEGGACTYLSVDSVDPGDTEGAMRFPVKFLNAESPAGLPPHTLVLKLGTIVMLLRNLNTRAGLCNGTRMIVSELRPNIVNCEVLTGSAAGARVFIPRIELTASDTDLPVTWRRRQFLIRAAFAMTVSKSQGQTLDKVGLYLPKPVFAHGMLYVALSRARALAHIRVQVTDTPEQGRLLPESSDVFTTNIVYNEVL